MKMTVHSMCCIATVIYSVGNHIGEVLFAICKSNPCKTILYNLPSVNLGCPINADSHGGEGTGVEERAR